MTDITKQFIEDLNSNLNSNLAKIEFQFNNEYGWTEFDPLRDEISKCLICDFCQAAITLTNHLLEHFLKTICIYSDAISPKNKPLFKGLIINRSSTNRFDGLDLSQTLNYAKSKGIITKEEWKILDKYRDEFRNAYSHAEKKKIFKDKSILTLETKIENGKYNLSPSNITPLIDIPAIQGIAQTIMSKTIAFEYFISVDKIIRSILDKFKNNTTT